VLFGQKELIVLSEIDESLINFIPTYRDILTRSPLSIFAGGEPLPKTLEKKVKDENLRGVSAHSSVGEASLLKGVVHGGLEKYFSPLKD
jgi:hypothetical protein